MGLTSQDVLVLSAVLALVLPVVIIFSWPRLPGGRVLLTVERLGLLLLAQGCAVLLAFVAVNDHFVFYTSWQDLLGSPPPVAAVEATGGTRLVGPGGGVSVYRGVSQPAADGSRLISQTVHGDKSNITAQVLVDLPPGYASSTRAYPVVELLPGWHNTPQSWIRSLHILQAMRAMESDGSLSPVITVIPELNVALPRDVECTNVPKGPQAEAWLTTDVHNLVLAQYRALRTPRSWAVMGYSTGGYCAAKLAMHRPDLYGSAVAISGYFEAIRDSSTGDLWGGSRALRNLNSPLWLLAHRQPPAVDILMFVSRADRPSYRSTLRFMRLARAPLQAFLIESPEGGHNYKAVTLALPEILRWLGGHLGAGPQIRG